MNNEITKTWYFHQAPQTVWEYLTRPELLEQWLMKSDFQPIVGHKFRFIGGCNHEGAENTAAAHCEVLEVTPFTRVSYSWQTNSLFDNKPFDSIVVWTLRQKDNGTELLLVHTGFTAAEDLAIHNDGWTRIGNKIVDFLNAVKQ